MKAEKILQSLALTARTIEPVAAARIAACIVYRGKIVGKGINQRKSHPLQAKYGRNEKAIYLHAEISAIADAIRFCGSVDFLSNSILFINRQRIINGEWADGIACPCPGCRMAIEAFSIAKVIYSTDKSNVYGELI